MTKLSRPMPLDLEPSKLGTKEHWDNVYKEELNNFREISDEGEIWFGVESVEKMVDWVLKYLPPKKSEQPSSSSILEIGSGNGALLFALVERGYDPNTIVGIDYSPGAVQLARLIAATKGGCEAIRFEVCDFLNDQQQQRLLLSPPPPPSSSLRGSSSSQDQWDLLLDKGTFDAIALGEKDDNGRSPASRYPGRVAALLKEGGFFLLTSCNFTEDELKATFTQPDIGLIYHSRVKHPTFSFGGKSGSMYATVAFQKPSPLQEPSSEIIPPT